MFRDCSYIFVSFSGKVSCSIALLATTSTIAAIIRGMLHKSSATIVFEPTYPSNFMDTVAAASYTIFPLASRK
ncbi:hypothetical protein CDL15_Pgr007001 [Punica granatum]|uniref:Uncharacterized protein n=1 Tax=Punica granatum TaxID=22663 RepID=A0A218X8C8_PUNGR|nr:hypothetical protein CDL15_Pgr007001 [Punica granatum]